MIKDAVIFLTGSLVASAGFALYFILNVKHNKFTESSSQSLSLSGKRKEEQDILEREQLSRMYAYFEEEGMVRIRKSFIVVVGAGGVGSHCALHLLRSGVGKIRIIDFDQVSLSSLNRHGTATRSDVGTPKVLAMKKTFEKILPSTEIDARIELLTAENVSKLLAGNPDYVVDCIDNIDTKIALLKYCHDNKIKVISSMGSACKSDPTRIVICDISKTHEDRLAKAVRSRLKKVRISKGVTVIFSKERNDIGIMPLYDETVEDPKQFAALPDFRVRVLPVLGAIPAIFGSAMAAYVLDEIGVGMKKKVQLVEFK